MQRSEWNLPYQRSANTYSKFRSLVNKMKLDTLAVHPAYQRCGYGTALVRWCCELADSQGEKLGVSAVPRSRKILEPQGFKGRVAKVERYPSPELDEDSHRDGFELWIAIREPNQR